MTADDRVFAPARNDPVIATVDPGIDGTGIAIWRPEYARQIGSLPGAAHALVEVRTLRTKAGSTVDRCHALYTQANNLFFLYKPAVIFLELPPIWHHERERGGKKQSGKHKDALFKLNRAFGALAVAAGNVGGHVVEIPASRMRQEWRFEQANRCTSDAGRPIPRNDDERSAVWIGLEVISAGMWRAHVPTAQLAVAGGL